MALGAAVSPLSTMLTRSSRAIRSPLLTSMPQFSQAATPQPSFVTRLSRNLPRAEATLAQSVAAAEPAPQPVTSSSAASPAQVQPVPSESAAGIAASYAVANPPRHDWTRKEIQEIYDSPLMDLIFHGARVHRANHRFREVQQCTLLSIKTGGCSEDCSYCSQSSRYDTGVKAEKLLGSDAVLQAAREAKEAGSTRFCMGAAWRSTVGRKTSFNQILDYVSGIKSMGMEVCCTLGMLTAEQAVQLKEAGLTAYNHNLDTSREYYPNVITTRTYDDRLETLQHVRDAGIAVCSGGIIGLGEGEEDRVGLLHTLATLPEHPESVPVNTLVPVPGTPLEDQTPVPVWELVRMIGTARIVMPRSMVRLSAGRIQLSAPEQALCFMAGANSIFTGDKLLTTPNNDKSGDAEMFATLGLVPMPSFRFESAGLSSQNGSCGGGCGEVDSEASSNGKVAQVG